MYLKLFLIDFFVRKCPVFDHYYSNRYKILVQQIIYHYVISSLKLMENRFLNWIFPNDWKVQVLNYFSNGSIHYNIWLLVIIKDAQRGLLVRCSPPQKLKNWKKISSFNLKLMYFIAEIYDFSLQNTRGDGEWNFFLWSPLWDFSRILTKILRKLPFLKN